MPGVRPGPCTDDGSTLTSAIPRADAVANTTFSASYSRALVGGEERPRWGVASVATAPGSPIVAAEGCAPQPRRPRRRPRRRPGACPPRSGASARSGGAGRSR